jgi:hypothetical protein
VRNIYTIYINFRLSKCNSKYQCFEIKHVIGIIKKVRAVMLGIFIRFPWFVSGPLTTSQYDFSIYQEITNRCHVTVLYFLLILYMSGLSQDDGRPHDTVTIPEVAYAVNFIDLLMMDTECVRNM